MMGAKEGGMNANKRIKALEAKRAKLQAKLSAARDGDSAVKAQQALDAVCYELAEEQALAAEAER